MNIDCPIYGMSILAKSDEPFFKSRFTLHVARIFRIHDRGPLIILSVNLVVDILCILNTRITSFFFTDYFGIVSNCDWTGTNAFRESILEYTYPIILTIVTIIVISSPSKAII